MLICNINGTLNLEYVFFRLDYEINNVENSRCRIFLEESKYNTDIIKHIKINEINIIEFKSDTIHYKVHVKVNKVRELFDDIIAPHYNCDFLLNTISMIGKIVEVENIKHHSDIVLDLIPTFKCNMACDYCFQKNHGDTIPECKNLDKTYGNIFNYLKNIEYRQINIFGGELSINLDKANDINKIAYDNLITDKTNRIKVFTNCKIYDEMFCNFIKEDPIKDLYISLSVLSEKVYDPRHIDIETTEFNIQKYINKLGTDRIKAVIVIDSNTINYLKETVLRLNRIGVNNFIIKSENYYNGIAYKNNITEFIDKYDRIITELTENENIKIWVRNDYTSSGYISFSVTKDGEVRSICELCLCEKNDGTEVVHFGPEDIVFDYNKKRLYSIVDCKEVSV